MVRMLLSCLLALCAYVSFAYTLLHQQSHSTFTLRPNFALPLTDDVVPLRRLGGYERCCCYCGLIETLRHLGFLLGPLRGLVSSLSPTGAGYH